MERVKGIEPSSSAWKTSALSRSKISTFVRRAKFSPRQGSCLTMGRHYYSTELGHAIAAAASSRRSAVQSCRCAESSAASTRSPVRLRAR